MANVMELELNWTRKMADFEDRLKAVTSPSNPSVLQLAEEFHAFKNLVANMMGLLRQQINDCTRIVDSMDMRQRQKVLLIRGIPEGSNVNVQVEVLKIVQERLNLPHITESSFKHCHRLGFQDSDRIRAVLLHFRDHDVKSEVWKAKSKLKGTAFTITEFLTRMRHAVHVRARKHFGMKNVWTLDGMVHVKVPGGGREKIVYEEELEVLMSRYPCGESPGKPDEAIRSTGSKPGTAQVSPQTAPTNRPLEARRKLPPGMTGDDLKRSRRAVTRK